MVTSQKVVINSSPLIFLSKLEFLSAFFDDAYEFYIPVSVQSEIEAKRDPVAQAIAPFIDSGILQVQPTHLQTIFEQLSFRLGRGEAETIALATEIQADFTILDDLAARKTAASLGLNVKGTLAIIKKLSQDNKIEIGDRAQFYQTLLDIDFRVSQPIFDSVFTDL
jgi:predicted nucleic acid-binding protein